MRNINIHPLWVAPFTIARQRKTMKRIIIVDGGDLAASLRTALNALAAAGIQIRPGTKLLTRYAVVVVDEAALDDAIAKLLQAGVKAEKDVS